MMKEGCDPPDTLTSMSSGARVLGHATANKHHSTLQVSRADFARAPFPLRPRRPAPRRRAAAAALAVAALDTSINVGRRARREGGGVGCRVSERGPVRVS